MLKQFLLTIFLSAFAFAQDYPPIVKVIDNNIFRLENGQTVQLADVYVPSINDTNEAIKNLANEINNWATNLLLNRNVKIIFTTNDFIPKARIYKIQMLGYEEDITQTFILKGYAILINKNTDNYTKILESQKIAQENKRGIWSLKPESLPELSTINESDFSAIQQDLNSNNYVKTEQPYLGLLSLSLASFLLAWDSFATASDIQEQIDFNNKLLPNYDSSNLESTRTRKYILGAAFILAGIYTTLFSLQSVEVQSNFNSLTVSYRF